MCSSSSLKLFAFIAATVISVLVPIVIAKGEEFTHHDGTTDELYMAETIEQGIKDLKEKIENLKFGAIQPRNDPGFLKRMLLCKKHRVATMGDDGRVAWVVPNGPIRCSMNGAIQGITEYYNAINKCYSKLDAEKTMPQHYKTELGKNIFQLLSARLDGTPVIVVNFNNWSAAFGSSVEKLCYAYSFMFEEVFLDPKVWEMGVTIVVDMTGFNMITQGGALYTNKAHLTNDVFKKFPIPIYKIYAMNFGFVLDKLAGLVSTFLPPRVEAKLGNVKETSEKFPDMIGREHLPKSLGGTLKEHEAFRNEFVNEILKQNIPYEAYYKRDYARDETSPLIITY